jgi:hypothetical protein
MARSVTSAHHFDGAGSARAALVVLSVSASAAISAASATELGTQSFHLDHTVAEAPIRMRLADGAGLLAVGEGEDGWRYSVLALADGRIVATGDVPASAFFYDAGDPAGRGTDQVCFLDERGIAVIDPSRSETERVLDLGSVYHGRPSLGPAHSDFVRDIDGDGADEILVPQFDGWLLARRGAEGFERELLVIPPRVSIYETRISYQPRPPRTGDVDGDGLDDIVFLRDREFVSFLQRRGDAFSTPGRVDAIDAPLATEEQRARWERDDGQVDQSELEIEEVELIRDFDGDGAPDLLTERSISEGVFDRRSEYHLYLGRRGPGSLSYPVEPDGSIASDGVQFDPLVVDVNGDGRLDVATPSTKLGLTRVVGALFSGRIGVDLDVYRMRDDNSYPEDSDYRTRFKVEFDLKTGLFSYPAVVIADLDGDGQAELLIQENEDTLGIHSGTGDSKLFDDAGDEASLPLPRNGQMVEAHDLDEDGRSELVVRYGPADGAALSRTVRVFSLRSDAP